MFDDDEAEAMWIGRSLKRGRRADSEPHIPASAAVSGTADGPLHCPPEMTPDPHASVQRQRPSVGIDPAAPAAQSSLDPDAGGIPGLDDPGDDVVLGNVVGMAAREPAGAPAPLDVRQEPSAPVAFPGVNAPIPDGADPVRWAAAGNGTLHEVRGMAQWQAAIGGSWVGNGRGVKRGFEAANVSDSGAAQQRYDSPGHSATTPERKRYRVRELGLVPAAPLTVPMAPQPRPLADKSAPLPYGHLHQPQQQQNGFTGGHPNAPVGHGNDQHHQHHHTGFVISQPGPLAQPANAGYAADSTQMAYYQRNSYPHASTAGMPAIESTAAYAWQNSAQWPAQPSYNGYMPSGSWQ